MDRQRGSSSRAPSPLPGDWRRCSVPHNELVKLQAGGYLPPAFMVPVRAGLATYKGGKQAEVTPNPNKGERVCFVPYLIRGLGFPVHPFLRGLLEFYGLQLHHLTPASILHIAGYVALCELFLGVEPHFALWKRLFCLVPRSHEGSIYQVGGAEIWRIAGTGYPSGTPKKASEDWPSEWFYIEDAPLPDPVRIGLPEFSNAPLKKHLSWRPRSPQLEEDKSVHYLMGRIRLLAHSGLTMIGVMATCIMRGVQPLQYRGHPMWDFNGEDDATRHGRKGPDSVEDLVTILSGLYKGEKEDFLWTNPLNGFSMNNPRPWVSEHSACPTHAF